MTPQNLGSRELKLLQLYRNCQFKMTSQTFYSRWNVTYRQMAEICGVSIATVNRWFAGGENRRPAEAIHQRRLAEMNFIWEEYEQIPTSLKNKVCPNRRNSKLLSS